jgi:hypothetical protein
VRRLLVTTIGAAIIAAVLLGVQTVRLAHATTPLEYMRANCELLSDEAGHDYWYECGGFLRAEAQRIALCAVVYPRTNTIVLYRDSVEVRRVHYRDFDGVTYDHPVPAWVRAMVEQQHGTKERGACK